MPKFVGHGDYAWPERLKDLNRPLKHADEEFQVAASGYCCEPGPQHIFLAPTQVALSVKQHLASGSRQKNAHRRFDIISVSGSSNDETSFGASRVRKEDDAAETPSRRSDRREVKVSSVENGDNDVACLVYGGSGQRVGAKVRLHSGTTFEPRILELRFFGHRADRRSDEG